MKRGLLSHAGAQRVGAALTLGLLLLACGSQTDTTTPQSNGGGVNIAGAQSTDGGVSQGNPADAASGGGASDPANSLDSLEVPSFQRIEATETPADLGYTVPAGATYTTNTYVQAMTRDGATVIVSVDHRWEPPAGGIGRRYRWRAGVGTEPFTVNVGQDEVISGDCSTLFGLEITYENDSPISRVVRWTEAQGIEGLEPVGMVADFSYGPRLPGAGGPYANLDGRAVLGLGGTDTATYALRWQEEVGWQILGTADSSLVGISDDGSVVALATSVWTEARGLEALPDDCTVTHLAPASGAIVGECPGGAFRRSADGNQLEIGEGEPTAVNFDGSLVVLTDGSYPNGPGGTYIPPRATAVWSEATGLLPVTGMGGTEHFAGLAESGVTLLFNDVTAATAETLTLPLRWSASAGWEQLPPPAGYDSAYATTLSTDGSIVAGFAFNGSFYGTTVVIEGPSTPQRPSGAVVVWDGQGPRVLAEELADLVDDPNDLQDGTPLFVTASEQSIYVIGRGTAPGQPQFSIGAPTSPNNTVWVAALPIR